MGKCPVIAPWQNVMRQWYHIKLHKQVNVILFGKGIDMKHSSVVMESFSPCLFQRTQGNLPVSWQPYFWAGSTWGLPHWQRTPEQAQWNRCHPVALRTAITPSGRWKPWHRLGSNWSSKKYSITWCENVSHSCMRIFFFKSYIILSSVQSTE